MAHEVKVLTCLALLALAGCGFQPLYGEPSSASQADLSRVRISPIRDVPDPSGRTTSIARAAQELRNFLLDRVTPRGVPASPLYDLSVTITESKSSSLGIRSDESATRASLTLNARYSLVRSSDGQMLTQSSARSDVSYNILRNEFATLSAENDARRRAARELSEAISTQVASALVGMRQAKP